MHLIKTGLSLLQNVREKEFPYFPKFGTVVFTLTDFSASKNAKNVIM
jgi:hypothetical protein